MQDFKIGAADADLAGAARCECILGPPYQMQSQSPRSACLWTICIALVLPAPLMICLVQRAQAKLLSLAQAAQMVAAAAAAVTDPAVCNRSNKQQARNPPSSACLQYVVQPILYNIHAIAWHLADKQPLSKLLAIHNVSVFYVFANNSTAGGKT